MLRVPIQTLLLKNKASFVMPIQQRTLGTYNSPEKPVSSRTLTDKEREFLEPMIRVDQAGEVGAYYIYKGQIAVLGHDKKLKPILQEMWDQEKEHLAKFDQLIGHHRVRPSLLRPFWEVAGYAVGYGTALIGKEAAMACTEAVETVIGNHYDDQLRELVAIKDHNSDLIELSKVKTSHITCTIFG
jgi:ubiquinone biosynthesis monooxygenase Coq7